MKYKEFVSWCNERACDGCWSMGTAIYCIEVMNKINALPFWKRKKEWLKVKDTIETDVVSVINVKIQALKGSDYMTALDYMKKQVDKHTANYEREKRRGAPAEVLENIKEKIGYYLAAASALEKGE